MTATEFETVIRRATMSDEDQVWPLARDFATSFVPEHDKFASTFATLVSDSETLVLVAVRGEVVVGYLLASTHLTFLANGPICWVEELMVDPHLRRNGIGRQLMAEAEAWTQQVGAAYISLASRRAGDFYTALGYDESATFYKKALAV